MKNTIKLKLKQTTNDKRFLMLIIHACRQLKCMSPDPKHVAKCLVCFTYASIQYKVAVLA